METEYHTHDSNRSQSLQFNAEGYARHQQANLDESIA